jgi:protein-S-isoprenylcysteine O-methyltransferase Ste14
MLPEWNISGTVATARAAEMSCLATSRNQANSGNDIATKGSPMLLQDHFVATGHSLFKRRSFVLLTFLPFMAYALTRSEPIEAFLGPIGGEAFEIAALAMVFGGLLIRIMMVGHALAGTSGRNTHAQVARQLNTTGFYSVTRNPLYLGNCMMYLGLILTTQSLRLGAVMAPRPCHLLRTHHRGGRGVPDR